jgi:hypothetical protein
VKQDHLVPQVCQDLLGLEAYQVHEVTKVRLDQWASQVNQVEMVTEGFQALLQLKVCVRVCALGMSVDTEFSVLITETFILI